MRGFKRLTLPKQVEIETRASVYKGERWYSNNGSFSSTFMSDIGVFIILDLLCIIMHLMYYDL